MRDVSPTWAIRDEDMVDGQADRGRGTPTSCAVSSS